MNDETAGGEQAGPTDREPQPRPGAAAGPPAAIVVVSREDAARQVLTRELGRRYSADDRIVRGFGAVTGGAVCIPQIHSFLAAAACSSRPAIARGLA